MTCGTVIPAHGPGAFLWPRQLATVPATCGLAMLVPERMVVPPPSLVERTQTPGAATVWIVSGPLAPAKLENPA